MVDNSAQLLRDLAALDIRLVLHGHVTCQTSAVSPFKRLMDDAQSLRRRRRQRHRPSLKQWPATASTGFASTPIDACPCM
jgi:hypothetical protein